LAAGSDVQNSEFSIYYNLRNDDPLFLANTDLLKLNKNAYNFETYQDKLAMMNFAFPRETFHGSVVWDDSTEFNSAQAFTLILVGLSDRVFEPFPQTGFYELLSDQEKN